MTKIGKSLHLNWEELACHDGTPYPSKFVTDGRIIEVVVMFERIRTMWGLPIEILSAYRTVAHNASVGGAKSSMHLEGKALDLRPPKGITVQDFYNMILWNAKEIGVMGIGKYPTFVHVDTRLSDKLIIW